MAVTVYLCLIFLLPSLTTTSYHDDYMEKYEHLIENLSHNTTYVKEKAEEEVHEEEHTEITGSPFPCSVLQPSPSVPTSVHMLRPGDVKVVGALGDSITAALGADANTILGLLTEYRGLSWSIGGDGTYEDQETLPNILKRYNPDLKGFSVGTGDDAEDARFNVAVTGSIASELPDQTRKLIDRMKNDPTVDFENDWKVITIMTGGNDICEVCFDEEPHNPANFIKHITTSLDMLKAEVPRVFVNMVETINVEIAKDLNKGIICTVVHVACRCAAFPDGEEGEKIVTQTTQGYHTATEELVNTGKYDTSDDFTVVVQPFLKETFLPRLPDNEPDMSFFAPDCFHLSRKGQAVAANALWNNMIEREGQKSLVWKPGEPIECPTEESPFFFTRKNSDLVSTAIAPIFEEAGDSLEVADEKSEDADDNLEVAEDSSEEADDNSESADDTNNGLKHEVNEEVHPSDSDKRRDGNTIAIGTSFVALAVIGLLLTALWTIQNHRKNRRRTGAYNIMNNEHVNH